MRDQSFDHACVFTDQRGDESCVALFVLPLKVNVILFTITYDTAFITYTYDQKNSPAAMRSTKIPPNEVIVDYDRG